MIQVTESHRDSLKQLGRAQLAPAGLVSGPALRKEVDGSLSARRAQVEGEAWVPARVVRCFPWSRPGEWYSIRDFAGEELLLVRKVADLDAESRAALEGTLVESGFLFEVTAVLAHTEEYELRRWEVDTRQGKRTFQTGIDEWPTRLPSGGLLMKDVAGDLYRVEKPSGLDEHSRKLLWSFID